MNTTQGYASINTATVRPKRSHNVLTSGKQRALGSTKSAVIGLEKRLKERKKPHMTIRQRIRNWLYADQNNEPDAVIRDDDDDEVRFDHDQVIHFAVIPAAGGKIVQIRYYDRKQDRHYNKLHLITPDEDLATSLAQILHLETLSR